MGGKEEEEAGDVAVKMPEATLKIFNGVQVGLHHYASTFCSQSNRGGGGIAREFLGCIRKKPFHGVYSCSQLNSIRGVSVGRFVRSFVRSFSRCYPLPGRARGRGGEGIYYLVELLGKRTGPLLRAC